MEKEKSSTAVLNLPHRNLQSPDTVTIERLVDTSDHKQMLALLRHVPRHPANHALDGFSTLRSQEQNWLRIAKKLVNLALRDHKVLDFIISMWMGKNKAIFERIAEKEEDKDVGETVFQLLIEIGSDEKGPIRVWCGLLLDERESTQQAFKDELGDALLDENSSLRMRVELAKQVTVLEEANQKLRSVQGEADSWKQRYEQEVAERQQEQATTKASHAVQTKTVAELRNTINVLQVKMIEAEEKMKMLDVNWKQEQDETARLRDEVTQIRRELVGADQQLDEVRENNMVLQSNEEKLQAQLGTLEKERDKVNNICNEKEGLVQALTEEVGKWQRLKQSTENQFQGKVKQQNDEIEKYRRLLAEKPSRMFAPLSLTQLDSAWQQSLATLSQQFSLLLTQQQRERQIITTEDKLADWQHWQQEEEVLVHTLFSSPELEHATYLMQVGRAQRLLLVRWYLLEWLRSTISQAVRVADGYESRD